MTTTPKTRLINPTKSELGKISKQILDRVNNEIRAEIHPNQWTNSNDVIEWFTLLENKKSLSFLVFDIVDFYPSITTELLSKCVKWAKSFTTISNLEHKTIMHARRTLLYDNQKTTWIKREGKNQFDV